MKKQIAQKMQKTKKPLRRILSAVLALCVLCTALPFTPIVTQAADDTTYTSGDYKYRILDDGTAEITDYTGGATDLTIPSSLDGYAVTSIGARAFEYCSSLKSITIPDCVTSIGNNAFGSCKNLTNVVISNGIEAIWSEAFEFCTNLKNIIIPDSVSEIGNSAFQDCTKLTSIQFGSGLQKIGSRAFSGTGLVSVVIPCSVVDMGNYEFREYYSPFYEAKSLKKVIFEKGMEIIPYGALMNCSSVEEVVIPDTITTIGSDAFLGCSNLSNAILPDSLTTILDLAFAGCSNLSTDLPNNLVEIGRESFANCSSLTSVIIPNTVISIESCAFSGTSITEVVIPNSVVTLGTTIYKDSPFSGIPTLKKVVFEDGFDIIPDYALMNCENVEEVIIPNGVIKIGWYAFSGCVSLSNIELPDSVIQIGNSAFEDCINLVNIDLPVNLSEIESSAFSGTGITDIIIPKSVIALSSFNESAFFGAERLKKVVFESGIEEIPNEALGGCSSVEEIVIPDSVISIGASACDGCVGLKKIVIPENVEEIGWYAFSGCKNLANVAIPDSVREIGWYAFSDCDSLTNLVIPNSVKEIGAYAFMNCDSLVSISLSTSVSSIGTGAFSNCENLLGLSVDSKNLTYASIDNVLFRTYYVSYSKLAALKQYPAGKTEKHYDVPSELGTCPVREINSEAFSGCKLVSVTIPDSISWIHSEAFVNCKSLKSVFILRDEISIGERAFAGCDFLTDIYYVGSQEDWNNKVNLEAESIPDGVIIHYNYDGTLEDPDGPDYGELHFSESFVVLDPGDTYQLHVYAEDGTEVTGSVTYSSLSSGIFTVDENGLVTALGEGTARVNASYKHDGQTFSTECVVLVGEPNSLNYTATYDSKYYAYEDGGFYSTSSSVSDSVDIYLLLENAIRTGLDFWIDPAEYPEYFKDIQPVTLTATIEGQGLSFSPDTYQNTYTATYDTIPVGSAVDELLCLYPMDLDLGLAGKSYTVTVTFTSESFDTVTQSYSFTVTSEAAESVVDHLQFMAGNADYQTVRQNIFGDSMVSLKNNVEYIWSKYSTLDFDNYYDIVLADILIEILDVEQVEMPSLIPSFIKDWVSNYKTLSGGVKTVLDDSYDEVLDLSDHEVGKILKKTRYKDEDKKITDKVFDTVLEHCASQENQQKIKNVMGKMEGANKFLGVVKFGKNILQSAFDWGNRLALLNTFSNADQAFKNVVKTFADTIPDSDYQMKEAVYDYVNYSVDWSGKISEIQEITDKLLVDVSLEVLKKMIGKSLFEFIGYHVLGWIGMSTISGGTAVFAATTTFSTVSAAFGAFFTGASLGLCLSDLLCDSSGKSEEMSKVVAMSEYAPYITETLHYYEQKLLDDAVNAKENTGSVEAAAATVDEFEYAFTLHKASQAYIMEHTAAALEKKAGSIIGGLLYRDDYQALAQETLALISTIDNLVCHTVSLDAPTQVTETKVIAIRCPVDVFVTAADGSELVRIVNDTAEYVANGIHVIVIDSEKYISLPANQQFNVEIVAREAGTMSYSVTEYGAGVQRLQTFEINDIVLTDAAEFHTELPAGTLNDADDYVLNQEGAILRPDEAITVPVTGIQLDQDTLQLNVGGKVQLSACIVPANASNRLIRWLSADPAIAEVDDNGCVTAISSGETTVYAVSEEWGYMAECVITVSTGTSVTILGDVDGNGMVNAADAVMVLRSDAGLTTLTAEQTAAADINGDGTVNASDAVQILRFDAGLIGSL